VEGSHELIGAKRATVLGSGGTALWIATERLPFILKVYPDRSLQHEVTIPEKLLNIPADKDPLAELVRGRLEIMGPVAAEQLAGLMDLPVSEINMALLKLENEGFVFQGNFSNTGSKEWCERRLLARIHRYTIKKLRSEIEPVSSADFMRFLFVWHQLGKEDQGQGATALEHILQKLEGFEAPAIAWESDILPARMHRQSFDRPRRWQYLHNVLSPGCSCTYKSSRLLAICACKV